MIFILLYGFIGGVTGLSCDSGSKSGTCVISSNQDVTGESVTASGDLVVESGGSLRTQLGSETTASLEFSDITVEGELRGNFDIKADSMLVKSGSTVSASLRGYGGGSGPGRGQDGGSSCSGGGGGGYGGSGGSSGGSGGSTYGSRRNPDYLGSGGGGDCWGQPGGPGGGKIILDVSNTLELNTNIKANGGNGPGNDDGAGSGGTINVKAGSLKGSGGMYATGGAGGWDGGGGGGGGRIAVRYGVKSMSLDLRVNGGLGTENGGAGDPGTVFTKDINVAPAEPSDPEPSDGSVISTGSTTISAEYDDPDGDSGRLYFRDGSGSRIDSCYISSPPGRCGVEWDSYSPGENDWYAVARDSNGKETRSDTWSFTYNRPPSVDSLVRPVDNATVTGNDTVLEAEVSDPDGDPLTVSFLDAANGSRLDDDTVSGSGTASGVWSSGNLDRGETEWWKVRVDDGFTSVESGAESFYVNQLPAIEDHEPSGVTTGSGEELEVVAEDKESGSLEAYFYTASGFFLGSDSGTGALSTRIEPPEVGEEFRWYVKVSDGLENTTSPVWSFTRVRSGGIGVLTSLRYDYSTVITSRDGAESVLFEVSNPFDENRTDLSTSLSGVDASFRSTGRPSVNYSLDSGTSKRFEIVMEPRDTGKLVVTTENRELGVASRTSIPVKVMETPATSTPRDVPGVGFVHVLAVVAASTLIYFSSL